MKSMTAYGRGEYILGDKTYTAELKSVNNRYRDLALRIPRSLQSLEDDVRTLISSRVRRGRVETAIQVTLSGGEEDTALELNLPVVKAYQEMFRQLNNELGMNYQPTPVDLLQIKDMVVMKPEEIDLEETKSGVLAALTPALDALDEMKNREGETLAGDIRMRLELVKGHLEHIKEKAPLIAAEYREKLKSRIESLMTNMSLELDESRLAQEVAIFAERSDITEEIVRAGSHLDQFQEIMNIDDSIGRRLDFLLQEINREINTMSAKASDSEVSARVVEIKAELEKIREQVQNVE